MTNQGNPKQIKNEHTLLQAKVHAKLAFAGCENCKLNCCEGKRFDHAGIFLSEVQDAAKLFPVIFKEIDKKLEMRYVFSIKKGVPCPYLDPGSKKCTVYDQGRPLFCRIYPFSFKFKVMRGSVQHPTISFDSRCTGLQESEEGIQILTDDGELSEEIFASFFDSEIVAKYEAHLHVTDKFLKLVAELDLLTREKMIFINKSLTGKGYDVELDVLKISEQKLAALDADSKMRLQTAGYYINVINAHLNSLSNYQRLYQALTAVEKPRQSICSILPSDVKS